MSDLPPPEVRAIFKAFCDKQRETYGPDWKKILAAEMTEHSMPVIRALASLARKRSPKA